MSYIYAITGVLNTIPLYDISNSPVVLYDVSNSIQITYNVRNINQKIGLIKDSSNIYILETSFNSFTQEFLTDEINIPYDDIIKQIEFNSIFTVGSLSSLYSNFASYVKTYFGYQGGFSSLYTSKNIYDFSINNGIFDISSLFSLIKNQNDISGIIDISYIHDALRYAIDSNCFNNRDASNGLTASDWNDTSNYGIADGFKANDIIMVSLGITLSLKLPIMSENFYSNKNNKGPKNLGTLNGSIINYTTDGTYYSKLDASSTMIEYSISAPLLIKLIDTDPSNAIFIGNITSLVDYTNMLLNIQWSLTDSSYNYIIIIWNNGQNNSGRIYDTSYVIDLSGDILKSYTFYFTPFGDDNYIGRSYFNNINTPFILGISYEILSDNSINLIWDGLYENVVISLATPDISSNQTVIYTYTRPDTNYSVIHDNSFNSFYLLPYTEYYIFITPIVDDISYTTQSIHVMTFGIIQNISADISTNSLNLTWDANTYRVDLYRGSTLIFICLCGEINEHMNMGWEYRNFNDTGLIPYTTYNYSFTVMNEIDVSFDIIYKSFKTTPQFISITTEDISTNSAKILWTGYYNNAILYKNLVYDTSYVAGENAGFIDTSFIDTELTPYTTYSFVITPRDISDVSYDTLTTTIKTTPKITSITFDISENNIIFYYSGYYNNSQLYIDNIFKQSYSAGEEAGLIDNSFTDTELTPYTTYIYKITPRDITDISYDPITTSITTSAKLVSASYTDLSTNTAKILWSGYYDKTVVYNNGHYDMSYNTFGVRTLTDFSYISSNLIPYTNYTYILTPKTPEDISCDSLILYLKTTPKIISITTEDISTNSAKIRWSGYYNNSFLYKNGLYDASYIAGESAGFIDTSFIDTNLTPYTTYSFIITPRNNTDISYNTLTTTIKTNPRIISITTEDISTNSAKIRWSGYYNNSFLYKNGLYDASYIAGENAGFIDTSFIDTNLTPYTTYSFIITPRNNTDISYNTLTTTIKTNPRIISITAEDISTNSAKIRWTGYYNNSFLYKNGLYDASYIAGENAGFIDTSFIETGLIPYTNYTYKITPRDIIGVSYDAITKIVQTTPKLISINTTDFSTNYIRIGYTGYFNNIMLYRNGFYFSTYTVGEDAGLIDASFTDTTVIPYTGYLYTLTPKSLSGTEYQSFSATIKTTPKLITISSTDLSTNNVYIRWTGYYYKSVVYRNGIYDISYVAGENAGLIDTSFNDTGLTPYTTYSYVITPINNNDISYNTLTTTIKTNPRILTLTTTDISTNYIKIRWTGYYNKSVVYRNNIFDTSYVAGESAGLIDISFTDTGLTPYTSYSYVVTPRDITGVSYDTISLSVKSSPKLTFFDISNVVTDVSNIFNTSNNLKILYKGYYNNLELYNNNILKTSFITAGVGILNDTSYNLTNLVTGSSNTLKIIPYNDVSGVYDISNITITMPNIAVISSAVGSRTGSTGFITITFTAPTGGTVLSYTAFTTTGVSVSGVSPLVLTPLLRTTAYTVYIKTIFTNGYISYTEKRTVSTT